MPEDSQKQEKDSKSQDIQARNHDLCSASGLRHSDKEREKGVVPELYIPGARTRRKKKAICLLDLRTA